MGGRRPRFGEHCGMELSNQVLEANERHKHALDQYTSKLQAELNAIDKLIVRCIRLPVLPATERHFCANSG